MRQTIAYRRIWGWICLVLLSCGASCEGGGSSRLMSEDLESLPPALRRLAPVVQLAELPGPPHRYAQYTPQGVQVSAESRVEIRYDSARHCWQHREVYHRFRSQHTGTEYYIYECCIAPGDTARRPFLDYRVVVRGDTAYVTDLDRLEFQLAERLDLGPEYPDLEVYRLFGFAHAGDPDPGHYKYWSPQTGTLLIWFGQGTTYELTAAPGWKAAELQALIARLKRTLPAD